MEPPPAGTVYAFVLDDTWTVLAGVLQTIVPPALPMVVEAEAPLTENTIASSAIADAITPCSLSKRNRPTLVDRMSSTSGRP
ncbi:MAG: hypothetical protein ACREOY_08985 [Candidatus Dormibacteraceae bacterium]